MLALNSTDWAGRRVTYLLNIFRTGGRLLSAGVTHGNDGGPNCSCLAFGTHSTPFNYSFLSAIFLRASSCSNIHCSSGDGHLCACVAGHILLGR